MENIKGTVSHITFQNSKNGYTVAVLDCGGDMVTVVGNFSFITPGDCLILTGDFICHPTFGEQFKVASYERVAPEGEAAILAYLSSGAIKGVGPSTARSIIERFHENALEIISENPERLSEIKGISLEKAFRISEEYAKQFNIRDVMLFLSKFNVTPEEGLKIYKVLKDNTVEIISQNPYILCDDEIGFSFSRVEEIASYFPASKESEYRAAAGITYILKHNLNNGHTYLPKDKLLPVAMEVLGEGHDYLEEILEDLLLGLKLRSKEIDGTTCIYLPDYYTAEEYSAAKIAALYLNPPKKVIAAEKEIELIEKGSGIKYEELQKKAIKSAIECGITLLTGGPGTGKTTTLKAIIKILNSKGLSVTLCAPTGRAAKRMSEITGMPAKTIHRLLEVEWDEHDRQKFTRNEKNPLNTDVLIIDEMSMVDIKLFESLLRAVPIGCRIVMVGDADQLPSVGAGNVLHDILASNKIPSVRLIRIFRQAMESLIVSNAHGIMEGKMPVSGGKTSDFFFINSSDPDISAKEIRELFCERLPNAYGFNSVNDIQILCPSKMLTLGSHNLNNIIQESVNPNSHDKKQLSYGDTYFREGDKVIQIKNNYDIPFVCDNGESGNGVYNGDIGILQKIDYKSGMFYIRFDDRIATYNKDNLSELELGYALTIHKSQGSEFECVIIPLLDTPKKLQYRNLLYTAVTRAKKLLIILGSAEVVASMINNDRKNLRYSGLLNALTEAFNDEEFN